MIEVGTLDEIDLVCDTKGAHKDAVDFVRAELPEFRLTAGAAGFFKVFGDSTRLRILWALYIRELCVCDISELLGVSVSAVSHQMKTLRTARLVKSRREGKNIYYSLDDDHVGQILSLAQIHIAEKDSE